MKICMILEGSYPFVHGGVSSWTHNYIQAMKEHEFVLWCIGAESKSRDIFKYKLPDNVTKVHQLFLDDALKMSASGRKKHLNPKELEALKTLISGEETDWSVIFEMFHRQRLNPVSMLMSEDFLETVKNVCREKYRYISFAEYFHTVRSMMLPELYLLTNEVPDADLYHATATGYSGILGSLAKWKNNKPFILTEHGIYTREREEELLRAQWVLPDFRSKWIQLFYNFSKCAYTYADRVTSLYASASVIQRELGCDKEKLRILVNGVNYERLKDIPPKEENGYIDIGAIVRIAQIKDIKTMIYAFSELKIRIPNVRLHILGDVDDAQYKQECVDLIEMLETEDIIFTGVVNIVEYMKNFDFTILTSISEAQPLAVLESFAASRPVVATDVGCCRDLIFGMEGDRLGQAGFLVPPMHKEELANAMERMCMETKLRISMGENGQKRVQNYYTHEISMNKYRQLYEEVIS